MNMLLNDHRSDLICFLYVRYYKPHLRCVTSVKISPPKTIQFPYKPKQKHCIHRHSYNRKFIKTLLHFAVVKLHDNLS